jgi:hypothetical protein
LRCYITIEKDIYLFNKAYVFIALIRLHGHKTRSVFERYNIFNENDLKRACEKLYAFHEEARNSVEETAAGTISIIKKSLGKKK